MEVTITIRGGAELLSRFDTLLPLSTEPAPAPVTPSAPATPSEAPTPTPAPVASSDHARPRPTKSDKPGPTQDHTPADAPAPWEVPAQAPAQTQAPAPAPASETSFAELVKLSNRISEARGMAWIGEYLSSKGVKTLRGLPPEDYPAIKLEFETILKDAQPQ